MLGSLLIDFHGKRFEFKQEDNEWDTLIAAFVLGLPVCESAIEEARYVQSGCLLRQEIELLAQLHAVKHSRRKRNRAPGIAVLPVDMKRIYSQLTELAHLSDANFLLSCVRRPYETCNETVAVGLYPVADPDLARKLFALHLVIMVYVTMEISNNSRTAISDRERQQTFSRALTAALEILRDEGLLVFL